MRSSLARQPAMTGESSISTPRTRPGRRSAAIRLRNPPSEWPTSQTGSGCASISASSSLTSPSQDRVTGKRGSCPKRSTAWMSKVSDSTSSIFR
ncbi:hypothetical protein GO283_01242 [Ralstonia solanacearum]|nr:hypothetical protein [Ralstonia solanacearum]NJZ77734.1 hypothetical protein [Ralstonia solanacearum]NJZ83917.1 hypothetical protein [Ralstonia solanacearum]NKA33732.1 hypothetical protein [Ralstonia solanacearum]NKA56361.1 hypothetical protein [Ralstonia solanacearum]